MPKKLSVYDRLAQRGQRLAEIDDRDAATAKNAPADDTARSGSGEKKEPGRFSGASGSLDVLELLVLGPIGLVIVVVVLAAGVLVGLSKRGGSLG